MSSTSLKSFTYQLYFDRNTEIYIDFTLEKIKNCKDLYNTLRQEIEEKVKEIYGNIKEENKNFNFILINSKI